MPAVRTCPTCRHPLGRAPSTRTAAPTSRSRRRSRTGRGLPLRRGRRRRDERAPGARCTERAHGTWYGRVPGIARRPALRLPGARAVGARGGPAVQPGQAAARPLRPGDRGRRRPGARGLRSHRAGRTCGATPRSATTATRRRSCPRGVVVDEASTGAATHSPRSAGATPSSTRRTCAASPSASRRARALRGTYAGLAHPAASTTSSASASRRVELLPVHAFVSEPAAGPARR